MLRTEQNKITKHSSSSCSFMSLLIVQNNTSLFIFVRNKTKQNKLGHSMSSSNRRNGDRHNNHHHILVRRYPESPPPHDPWEVFEQIIRSPYGLERLPSYGPRPMPMFMQHLNEDRHYPWPTEAFYPSTYLFHQGNPSPSPPPALPRPERTSSGRVPTVEGENAVNKIHEVVYGRKTGGGDMGCAICLEELKEKQRVGYLPCTHVFHMECVTPWVRSHALCPVCRFDLSSSQDNSVSPSPSSNPCPRHPPTQHAHPPPPNYAPPQSYPYSYDVLHGGSGNERVYAQPMPFDGPPPWFHRTPYG